MAVGGFCRSHIRSPNLSPLIHSRRFSVLLQLLVWVMKLVELPRPRGGGEQKQTRTMSGVWGSYGSPHRTF